MKKQNRLLLEYLINNKKITGIEALHKLGVFSYTKRISELRAMGCLICTHWETKKSRFGKKRFAVYELFGVPKKIKKMLDNNKKIS